MYVLDGDRGKERFVYYCPDCDTLTSNPENSNNKCEKCSGNLIQTSLPLKKWEAMNKEDKIKVKEKLLELDKPSYSGESVKSIKARMFYAKTHPMIVTTCDLKRDYDVLGPVYYQINDTNSGIKELSEKINEYQAMFKELKENKQLVTSHSSSLDNLINVTGMLEILTTGGLSASTKDLLGQNHKYFDIAFFIALEELKKRAYLIGADAIVGMKQDLDLDTSGFQHFYLQMYGTAVKFIN